MYQHRTSTQTITTTTSNYGEKIFAGILWGGGIAYGVVMSIAIAVKTLTTAVPAIAGIIFSGWVALAAVLAFSAILSALLILAVTFLGSSFIQSYLAKPDGGTWFQINPRVTGGGRKGFALLFFLQWAFIFFLSCLVLSIISGEWGAALVNGLAAIFLGFSTYLSWFD